MNLNDIPHKRCPCCDGVSLIVLTDLHGIPLKLPLPSKEKEPLLEVRYIVRCTKCGVQTPPVLFEQEAWKIWNRRKNE